MFWDFPGSLLVKILLFQCRGTGSIPNQGTKTPHADMALPKKNISCYVIHITVIIYVGH